MPYAELKTGRVYYTRSQSQTPDAPALVLIHGAGGSHLNWPAELRRLPNALVYALDLPGHGRSDGPSSDTIDGYVAALTRFLDVTGIGRAVLAGHSMGGAISQVTALQHPDRVAGLVLVGTGARLRVAPAILDGVFSDFESAVDLITRFAWAQDAPGDLKELGRKTMAETPPEVIHGDFIACDAFDVMDRLDEISAPALVVAGTVDRLTPHKYGAHLAERIPNARLFTVEGGAHMMALEQPDAVASAVAEFIQDLH